MLAACALQGALPEDGSRRAGFARSDGVRIAYDVQGKSDIALVLVHGWSCDRTYWSGQVEPLSREFRVVTVDLAGHGESGTGTAKDWTIESYGSDVAAVVEKLGLQRVILVGHSMGGDVVADAARLLPGRVVGMVWVDTYSKLGSPRTREQREAMMAPFRANFVDTTRGLIRDTLFRPGADPQLVDRVAADMSAAPPDIALAEMESSFSNDARMPQLLEQLKLPVIAINPDTPPTDRESLQHYGVNVVLMPGVGHFMMMEDPARFNRLLRATVKTIGAR